MTPHSGEPLRVLAVVHNRILREGICCLVETKADLALAGAVSTAEAAVLQFAELRPDVTLLDLDLPDDSAFGAMRSIRSIDPEAWIIALITDEADERSLEAVALGAATVIAKHLIGKVPWGTPSGPDQTPLKTGGSNTRSIGVLNGKFSH